MKKFFALMLSLLLTASMAMAAEKSNKKATKKADPQASSSRTKAGSWVLQFQGGMSLYGASTGDERLRGTGLSGDISFGHFITPNISLSLLVGHQVMDVEDSFMFSSSWTYNPVEIVGQYTFNGTTRPYLFFGLGLAEMTMTGDIEDIDFNISTNERDVIFSPGFGVQADLGKDSNMFAQIRLDIINASGGWLGDTGWKQPVVIPVQVGVNFVNL
jgi:hypothetical protein